MLAALAHEDGGKASVAVNYCYKKPSHGRGEKLSENGKAHAQKFPCVCNTKAEAVVKMVA